MSMKITLEIKNVSVTIKTDGENRDDALALFLTVLSWHEGEEVIAYFPDDDDDNIYCEGIEPSEEREIEGL
jgi:hypothetical protein